MKIIFALALIVLTTAASPNNVKYINEETENLLQELEQTDIDAEKLSHPYGFLYDLQRKLGDIIITPILATIITIFENHPELREKLNHAGDVIKAELKKLNDSIKPHVDRVVYLLRKFGADIKKVANSLKVSLASIIDKLQTIAEENKAILKDMLNKFVDKLLDIVSPEEENETEIEAFAPEEMILDNVYERFIYPILQRIRKSLERILKLLKEKSENAKEIIEEEIQKILKILKPRVQRIVEIAKKLGANADQIRENFRDSARKIIDNIYGITDETRKALRDIANRIINDLIEKMEPNADS